MSDKQEQPFTADEIHAMSMLHDRDCGTVECFAAPWSISPVTRKKVDHCTCRRQHYVAALARKGISV